MKLSQKVKESKKAISIESKKAQNDSRQETMIQKYGVPFNSQRQELKHIWEKPKITYEILEYISNRDWLFNEYVIKKRTAVDIAKDFGIDYSTVLTRCRQFGFDIRQTSNYSLVEREISTFIQSLNISVIENTRSIIDPYELDLYMPDFKLAIEVNGLYWHSFHPSGMKQENKSQHLNKTIECTKLGIDLIHITDQEWRDKRTICESIITNRLNLSNRIYARKCTVQYLSIDIARKFFDMNHMDGFSAGIKYVGLFHNSELVLAIIVGRDRFNKGSDAVELIRMATRCSIQVVGGFSKLIKYITKSSSTTIIVSYVDSSKYSGSGYSAIGFELVHTTPPGYFWTDGNISISRYRCQKKNLSRWLESYNDNKSESQNMFDSGYRRYWNCGNKKFTLAVTTHE